MENKETPKLETGSSRAHLLVMPPDYYTWTYTKSKIWVLGFITENYVYDIQATAKRNKNGSWFWRIPISDAQGTEPSRTESFKTVHDALQLEAV